MNFAEVLLGVMAVLSGLAVTAAVFFSDAGGNGLSAVMGGSEIQAKKKKATASELVEKVVVTGGVILGVCVLLMGIYAAHM